MGAEFFQADGQADMTNLKVTFSNFANAFKKSFYASVSTRSCSLFSQSAYREKLKENQSCKCRCQEAPLRTVTIGTTVTLRRKIELFHYVYGVVVFHLRLGRG
jgi:hypothetical protein